MWKTINFGHLVEKRKKRKRERKTMQPGLYHLFETTSNHHEGLLDALIHNDYVLINEAVAQSLRFSH